MDTLYSVSGASVDRSVVRRGWLRNAALILSAIFSLAFADAPAAAWVHQHTFCHATVTLLKVIRLPGHFGFTIGLVVLLLWRCNWDRGRAVSLIAAGAIASGVTAILKLCFGRLRPFRGTGACDWRPFWFDSHMIFSGKNLSFPSGDATLAFATAAVVSAAAPEWKWLAMGWAIAVGVARVVQGAHYPSDVLGAALIGLVTADVVLRSSAWSERRRNLLIPPD